MIHVRLGPNESLFWSSSWLLQWVSHHVRSTSETTVSAETTKERPDLYKQQDPGARPHMSEGGKPTLQLVV